MLVKGREIGEGCSTGDLLGLAPARRPGGILDTLDVSSSYTHDLQLGVSQAIEIPNKWLVY